MKTLNPTPYTPHPTPYTPHPSPQTLNPKPQTLHPPPYTLNPPDPDRWHAGTPCFLSDCDWHEEPLDESMSLKYEPASEGLPWFGPDSIASYCDRNNAFTGEPCTPNPEP